jgi:hypothetical protein
MFRFSVISLSRLVEAVSTASALPVIDTSLSAA